MFNFTPLAGARTTSRASQSLLELDGGVKILVDVGWDERFDTRQLASIEKHVSTLSFILLTHATISHLGAFAHCSKHIPLFSQIPVYATAPVVAFGRTLLQDLYTSAPEAATFIPDSVLTEDGTPPTDDQSANILRDAPSAEDINKYFSNITPLKYSQPHQPTASYFSAPLEGLTLSAYNAGHTLGGTIWHIQHGMESIVYAVDWHQARENVMAGAAWFDGMGGAELNEQLRNPTALICSSANGDKVAVTGCTKVRDEVLVAHIKSTIARGGDVLIPTDSSARMIELSFLIEKTWQEHSSQEPYNTAKVYMASRTAHSTLRNARSLLEWMDDSIVREFEGEEEATTAAAKTHKRGGSRAVNGTTKPTRPFEFRHIKVVETPHRLNKALLQQTSKVIIASDTSLWWGCSRAALHSIAQKSGNLVLLTDRPTSPSGKNSAGIQTLWSWHQQRQKGVSAERISSGQQIEQVYTEQTLTFQTPRKAPLDAAETAKYQQYLAAQRRLQESLVTADARDLVEAEDVMDEDESSSDSEDGEDEQQGRVLNVSAALTHGTRNKVALTDEDLGVNILIRKKNVHDFDVRNKRGRNAVFPYAHSRRRGDDFGEIIRPEDFLREEERDAQDNLLGGKDRPSLGLKRKWSEPDLKQNKSQKKQKHSIDVSSAVEGDQETSDTESDDEQEPAVEVDTGPQKLMFEEEQVNFQAKLAFVDFAGIHDQRGLQMLIPLIAPKKLVLIGGTQAETDALSTDCAALLGIKMAGTDEESNAEIFSPEIGESVDASVDTNSWVVKLTKDLARRLHWQNVKNMAIVTVNGQLRAEAARTGEQSNLTATKRLKLEQKGSSNDEEQAPQAYEPVLDNIPPSVSASRTVTQPIHVGDLRLADLRRLMRESGHQAIFRGEGTLLIDDMVVVRKSASGKITVEGPPVNTMRRIDSFAEVKRKIYDGLAVVAAG